MEMITSVEIIEELKGKVITSVEIIEGLKNKLRILVAGYDEVQIMSALADLMMEKRERILLGELEKIIKRSE